MFAGDFLPGRKVPFWSKRLFWPLWGPGPRAETGRRNLRL